MATTSKVNMKGFYRQKKKSGIAKSSSTKTKKSPKTPTTLGSDLAQPPALISHGSLDLKDEYDDHEEVLRQFDMNMAYGPCLGMSRLARWERANKLGLNPPEAIEALLKGDKARNDCLWDGRV